MTEEQNQALEKAEQTAKSVKAQIAEMGFPSNSEKSKKRLSDGLFRTPKIDADPEKKNVQRVVKGKITKKKKPLGRTLHDIFVAEESKNVFSYVLHEVLIPAAKALITDTVTTGIERFLYGGDQPRANKFRNGPAISYGNYFKNNGNSKPVGHLQSGRSNSTVRVRQSFDDIIFERRSDADEVLTNLVELVNEYETASIADLYDLVGIETSYTDNKHGWDNMGKATIIRVHNGYALNLPRPIELS